jgi:hypothetical protein
MARAVHALALQPAPRAPVATALALAVTHPLHDPEAAAPAVRPHPSPRPSRRCVTTRSRAHGTSTNSVTTRTTPRGTSGLLHLQPPRRLALAKQLGHAGATPAPLLPLRALHAPPGQPPACQKPPGSPGGRSTAGDGVEGSAGNHAGRSAAASAATAGNAGACIYTALGPRERRHPRGKDPGARLTPRGPLLATALYAARRPSSARQAGLASKGSTRRGSGTASPAKVGVGDHRH